MLSIKNEYSALKQVIIGRASPYQRDKVQVAAEMKEYPLVPDTSRKAEVLALTYPTEKILQGEFANYLARLDKYGVDVLLADPDAAYSFDYTCPRDIGFVIGDIFFIANMSVQSRANETRTIQHHLNFVDPDNIVRLPNDCLLEGGDVIILDPKTVLVGYNQRSSREGCRFVEQLLAPLGLQAIPVLHSQLHLDCCLNPLGKGHLLIHPQSLKGNDESLWRVLEQYDWIEVDTIEREHLATNILSIGPDTIIARNHASCARVNQILRGLGYIIEAIGFDGVPATGGSFRCASLPLSRLDSLS